jgi:hypothetical protein
MYKKPPLPLPPLPPPPTQPTHLISILSFIRRRTIVYTEGIHWKRPALFCCRLFFGSTLLHLSEHSSFFTFLLVSSLCVAGRACACASWRREGGSGAKQDDSKKAWVTFNILLLQGRSAQAEQKGPRGYLKIYHQYIYVYIQAWSPLPGRSPALSQIMPLIKESFGN